MRDKTRTTHILLNVYTILLTGLFMIFNNQSRSVMFIITMFCINIAVFSVTIIANKKEIRIHYVVGKSKKRLIKDSIVLDISSQLGSLLVFVSSTWLILKTHDIGIFTTLTILIVTLSSFKAFILYILLRKII
ncbi:hypothetical protein CBF27_04560 [Vagococcus acidifermentans]|uniref:Uncharacterized protein n=1 Tax=Vagococcus acidifermentans TaxID=564710 RepID=A0A430AZI3_9ENTE|nr:hypothetical protein CBF27_04560 [Vagococcus acidifermentans]